ncbi:hypothetical protein ACHQM5_017984 [Ranunculus cassubicifolius]
MGKFNIPGNTSNALGAAVTPAFDSQFPGLNTMGISFIRIDFAPGGVGPLHTHPRASELLVCIQGTLLVGFVTSNPEYRLFSNVLHPGDLFVFPQGLIHFQQNIGHVPAVAFASLGSQNPGLVSMGNGLFNSTPPLPNIVLEKSFGVDKEAINQLRSQFGVA